MVFFVGVDEFLEHGVEDGGDGKEPLDSGTDVVESLFVVEDLLDDERGHSLRESLSVLHDSQAERDDFRLHQERNGVLVALFDQSPDHAQRSHTQVLEDLALGRSVQERVQEQRNVG